MGKKVNILIYLLLLITAVMVAADQQPKKTLNTVEAGIPARIFETAKSSTPELIAFVRRMPKGADLHFHLSGSAYCEFLLDSAEKQGFNYNVTRNTFTFDSPKQGKETIVTIAEVKKNAPYLSAFMDVFSMRGWFPATANGHEHFFAIFDHLSSLRKRFRGIELEILVQAVKRARYQNIQYMELMTRSVPPGMAEMVSAALGEFDPNDLEGAFKRVSPLLKEKANFSRMIRQYLDERDKQIQAATGLKDMLTGNDGELVVRYVSTINRLADLKGFFVSALCAARVVVEDRRVVAMNIAAPEDRPASRLNFDKHMEILDFLYRKMGEPTYTLHGGELSLRESPVEPMRTRISDTITKGHARRIGHGASVAWEDDVFGLLDLMRREGILVEICLSSNESILGIQGKDHPFQLYRRAGVPVSLCTDDEGISRGNLTVEFIKAIQRYGLGYGEVKTLVYNSLEYSFLPGESLYRDRDYGKIRPLFEGVRTAGWKPGQKARRLMGKNPKLKRQVMLERAFVEFEAYLGALKGLYD